MCIYRILKKIKFINIFTVYETDASFRGLLPHCEADRNMAVRYKSDELQTGMKASNSSGITRNLNMTDLFLFTLDLLMYFKEHTHER